MAITPAYADRAVDPGTLYEALADKAREIYNGGKKLPLVLIDMDDCLFDRRPRWIKIIADLLMDETGGSPLTDEHRKTISTLKPRAMTPDIEATLRSTGLDDDKAIDFLVKAVEEKAQQDAFVMFDLPTPGAVDFIKDLSKAGSMTLYLAGERSKDKATFGTERTISMFELPAPRGEVGALFMPDTPGQTDLEFKRELLGPIGEAGEVIAVFDNDPAAINVFADAFPEARTVLFDGLRVGEDVPLRDGVEVIDTFVR